MKEFKPRTTCPTPKDKWYCRKGYGGDSPCIAGKPEAWKGSVLANCVGYAFGRVAELMGKFIKIGYTYGNKPYSAQNWFGAKDGLKRGQAPKLGAVACWEKNDGNSGHVCIVEKIDDKGGWDSSESAYNGAAFKSRHYLKSSYRKGFRFQGFIYLPEEFVPAADLKVRDKVEIIGPGNSNSSGTGYTTTKCIGWKRVILAIKEGAEFPYRVGVGGITTAWFKASSLKKL